MKQNSTNTFVPVLNRDIFPSKKAKAVIKMIGYFRGRFCIKTVWSHCSWSTKNAGLENDSRTEVEGCYFRPSLWQPIVFCKQNSAVTHKALGVGSIQGDLFGRNFN